MVTTNSFPNQITNPHEDLQTNTLSKEDLEGKVKENILTKPNPNGGDCQNIIL